ncbi:hypothetical protein G6026_16160 [Dietzia sp. DQ11-38-2]|uniref:hypothetical protein n=2 Tax=unclassified Dietzia TaxID=2617939 RepID=UPI0015F95618|nr:hypothetical protein [Dietzia sp. DQ11-38-2]MBB1029162.1 hypothetical protein [Dietzia sp. DQ11-38-2]
MVVRAAAVLAVTAAAVTVVVVASTVGPAAPSSAAPADTSTLMFEVVDGTSGDLHIAVAAEGGLALPVGSGVSEVTLADTAVIDSRGGGSRDWSASVAATGLARGPSLSYRVVSPTGPGAVTNRMPDWTPVGAPRDALAVSGIVVPSASWRWTPRVRVDRAVPGLGSTGPSAPGRGALITSAL